MCVYNLIERATVSMLILSCSLRISLATRVLVKFTPRGHCENSYMALSCNKS